MKIHHPDAERIAQEYIGSTQPLEVLGWGVGGAVFVSPVATNAVKVHLHVEGFERELSAYRRLRRRKVIEVLGLSVPRLVKYSSRLRVIEMSMVKPPYLLDFANARLDKPPDFPPETMQLWWDTLQERFGDRYGFVRSVYRELAKRHRIYYLDFKPGNIEFGDMLSR